ncbi:MAG TPA: phosphoribosylanthranilate isomerase [Acidimicrobiales bacterium]
MDIERVPQIKICGVTTLGDAHLVADTGADALGLVYASSVRQVVGDVAGDIIERFSHQFWCVGVFRHQSDQEILRIVQRDTVPVVQLHDPASDDLLDALAARGVRVIRALTVTAPELTDHEASAIVAVIVDGAQPGSGVANDWSLVTTLHFDVPMLVAGGLAADTVSAVIDVTNPWGVDVATGVEFSHGVKDRVKVANFVTRAREALSQKGAS